MEMKPRAENAMGIIGRKGVGEGEEPADTVAKITEMIDSY